MKTTFRSNRVATAKYEFAALLCMAFVLTGCEKEAAPSAEKALVQAPLVVLRENVRSDSGAPHLAPLRAEKSPEPQRDSADNAERLAIESRTESAALEREERLLLETIVAAKAGSVLTEETESIKNAERALDLATDRYLVGTGTKIEVLNAQAALTEARGAYIDALRTYSAARATFVRAPGAHLPH